MLASIVAAGFGSLAFAILFYVDDHNLFYATLAGIISTGVYLLLIEMHVQIYSAVLISTICFSLYAEAMARIRKATVTTFIICGMIPLVPGGGMYNMMVEFTNNNYPLAIDIMMEAMGIAGMLALGIIIATTIGKIVREVFNIK